MSRFSAMLVAERLAEQSRAQRGQPFLAPLQRGGLARFRVAGLMQSLRVPDALPGWWICRQVDARSAEMIAPAEPWQRADYLALWPALPLVLVEPVRDGTWIAVPYNLSDALQRFRITGPVLVRLVEGGQAFERIQARVEGQTLWFDELDRRGDALLAADLRSRLAEQRAEPDLPNLGPGEQLAYALLRSASAAAGLTAEAAREQARVRAALAIGGAILIAVDRTEWGLSVTWDRHGQQHTAVVDDRLTVVSSGICLSDRDDDFDLTSLVSVVEEDV